MLSLEIFRAPDSGASRRRGEELFDLYIMCYTIGACFVMMGPEGPIETYTGEPLVRVANMEYIARVGNTVIVKSNGKYGAIPLYKDAYVSEACESNLHVDCKWDTFYFRPKTVFLEVIGYGDALEEFCEREEECTLVSVVFENHNKNEQNSDICFCLGDQSVSHNLSAYWELIIAFQCDYEESISCLERSILGSHALLRAERDSYLKSYDKSVHSFLMRFSRDYLKEHQNWFDCIQEDFHYLTSESNTVKGMLDELEGE